MTPAAVKWCTTCSGSPSAYVQVVLVDPVTCEPLTWGGGAGGGPINPTQRQVLAGEARVVAFSDAGVVTLGPPPANANHAEIHVEGGAMRFTTDGIDPSNAMPRGYRVSDWGRIELESLSEVTNFKTIGLPGQSGTLYVEYFNVPYVGYANA